jgi:hypothetical protein
MITHLTCKKCKGSILRAVIPIQLTIELSGKLQFVDSIMMRHQGDLCDICCDRLVSKLIKIAEQYLPSKRDNLND